jgi:hypothetical protein
MKLTIMQMCRIRCSRENRTNWRFASALLGKGGLPADGFSKTWPLGIGIPLVCGFFKLGREFRFRGA